MKILINPTNKEKGNGQTAFISWDSILQYLVQAVYLRSDETVKQLEVDKDGITISILKG